MSYTTYNSTLDFSVDIIRVDGDLDSTLDFLSVDVIRVDGDLDSCRYRTLHRTQTIREREGKK